MKIHYVALLSALGLTLGIQAWPWSSSGHELSTTWRWPHYAKTNTELNDNCNAICKRHKEKWTTNWHNSWHGQSCECKASPKSSWFHGTKEVQTDKLQGIAYRSVAAFKTAQELAQKCNQLCEEHAEQYTGQWKHVLLGGYKCACKKEVV